MHMFLHHQSEELCLPYRCLHRRAWSDPNLIRRVSGPVLLPISFKFFLQTFDFLLLFYDLFL